MENNGKIVLELSKTEAQTLANALKVTEVGRWNEYDRIAISGVLEKINKHLG